MPRHPTDSELLDRVIATLFHIVEAELKRKVNPYLVAKHFGIATNTLNNWIAGKSPTLSTLNTVAAKAKMDVWELLHPDLAGLKADLDQLADYRSVPTRRNQEPKQ